MKTTKLHTFKEILTEGICVDDEKSRIKVLWIFIPKIQRSYAQGRNSETDVRTEFLNDIFATLTSPENKPLELSFLFGSKQPMLNGTGDGFELLDGQQRTTTLFLLHWYIYCREADEMPDFLGRFTYETRDTSTQFLKKISCTKVDLSQNKPSKALKSNKWFTDDFNCDATICAMLNMLDDIHDAYNEIGETNLHCKLERLQFYVLLLENFDMNDELYIKMNARGLSLTPFENFKASIVKYMKSRGHIYGYEEPIEGEMPHWLNFISEMDSKWIDIFWQNPYETGGDETIKEVIEINNDEIGNRYFRFFNRYFFTKAAIIKGVEKKKLTDLPSFFYYDAESEGRLKGWKNYELLFALLDEGCTKERNSIFGRIRRILDVFHKHSSYIFGAIKAYEYGNTSNFDIRNSSKDYTLPHRVIFAAVTEFIETIPQEKSFDEPEIKENFRKMLRVAHNIIENTLFENTVALVGVINAIVETIHAKDAVDGDFYKALANLEIKSANKQLIEEQEKAREMYDTNGNFIPEWEEAFINAEKHPFLKGSVRFFFSPKSCSYNMFNSNYNVINTLFGKEGIRTEYRTKRQHILIRAILSCLNKWESDSNTLGMKDRYFTENAEKEKYLKNILLGSNAVKEMFCNYFYGNNAQTGIDEYLKKVISEADICDHSNKSFEMLYNRLIKDERAEYIFDWIEESEKKSSQFRIQDNRSYIVAIPGTWYHRLVLDTERHKIIPDILKECNSFKYADQGQENSMNGPMQDTWGWQIAIKKEISPDYTLELVFNEYKKVKFIVHGEIENISQIFETNDGDILNDGVEVAELHYQFYNDKSCIIDKINKIEEKLSRVATEA